MKIKRTRFNQTNLIKSHMESKNKWFQWNSKFQNRHIICSPTKSDLSSTASPFYSKVVPTGTYWRQALWYRQPGTQGNLADYRKHLRILVPPFTHGVYFNGNLYEYASSNNCLSYFKRDLSVHQIQMLYFTKVMLLLPKVSQFFP